MTSVKRDKAITRQRQESAQQQRWKHFGVRSANEMVPQIQNSWMCCNSTLRGFGQVAFYKAEVFAARRFAARGARAAMKDAKTEGLYIMLLTKCMYRFLRHIVHSWHSPNACILRLWLLRIWSLQLGSLRIWSHCISHIFVAACGLFFPSTFPHCLCTGSVS